MTALLVFAAVVAGLIWLSVWAIRTSNARQRVIDAQWAQARAAYLRRRAEFLAGASPIEAQAFLMDEQTNALIEAQRRHAAALGLMIWLNGSNSPLGSHHCDGY